MGCSSSKLDDLPAVALCRQRCAFLDDAIYHRHALAEAHLSYLHSLKGVGISLLRFFDHDLLLNNHSTSSPLPSPVIPPPPQFQTKQHNNVDNVGSAPIHHHHHLSHSNSGSHLHFQDSDSHDSVPDSPLHHHSDSGNNSPFLHNSSSHGQFSYAEEDHEALIRSYPVGDFLSTNMNLNYMKNKAAPSVSYEQRPVIPQTVYMGESSSSSYYPPPNENPHASSYSTNYYGGGPAINGFFGSPPSYGSSYGQPAPVAAAEASTSTLKKPPPPPPSPPRNTGWDFLNPFESFDNYYPVHTSSRGSNELREEEGIPDLEDEDFQQEEVVKEVQVERKFVDSRNYAKGVAEESDSDSLFHIRPDISIGNDPGEYEVHMVDKKVVDDEERRLGGRGNVAAFKAHNDSEVVREIQVQFERASESGDEVAKMLDVRKFAYKKNSAYQVSSKMFHGIKPSLPVASSHSSTSENGKSSSIDKDHSGYLEIDEEVVIGSGNLSSTLQKLHLWEKKLYDEIMVEEKLRVLYENNCRKLKRLDERGAEAHKIDATRTLVRSLSSKIRIAIQVVDNISVKINKLRDEELWPQLNSFIQGLTRLWKSMLQCHRSQCQAIGQAKQLDAVAMQKYISDARLEAMLQLEHDLVDWTSVFSSWVGAQKGFVRALNNWLLKCLLYVPEETADGTVPFSPSRIGAPPVFVICNQWSQAMERIPEKEVVECMRDFVSTVLQLWERDKLEMQQRVTANKDMERKVKKLEREDRKIRKEIEALDKRIVLVFGDGNGTSLSGHPVYQSDTSKTGSLQVSLLRSFEAMEGFMENSLRAYEELLKRIEEDRRDRLGHGSKEVS